MKELKHLAKSLYQNELNLEDEIIAPEEDYHNRRLLRTVTRWEPFNWTTAQLVDCAIDQFCTHSIFSSAHNF